MATRGQVFFLNMKLTQCSFQRAKSLSQSYLKNCLSFTNFVNLNYLHISYFIFLMHLLYGIQQFTASALKIKHWDKTRSDKSGIYREDLETYYSFIHVYLFFYQVRIHTEKAMAPLSSTLAWKIPWVEEPGRLQSMGSLRVGHD